METEYYDDFLRSIGIDPNSVSGANFGNNYTSNDDLYKQITGGFDNNNTFNPISLITKLLSGTGEQGKAGQLAGVAGLYSLINALGGGLGQTGQGVYKGYTGGIPKYTAERTQYALPTIPLSDKDQARVTDEGIKNTFGQEGYPQDRMARTMYKYGISPERVANIFDVPVADVQSSYRKALGPNQNLLGGLYGEYDQTTHPNRGNYPYRRPGSGGVTYFSPMTYTPTVVQAPPTGDVTPKNAAQFLPEVKAASGGMMAAGGISTLGGYSDGGRLLRGPGDGVSDSIPAIIGNKQPARLADGEFVIPARVVSEIGNGSTDAGAKKLYAMMDRIQKARKKSIKNVAANTKADKYLPA